MNKKPKKKEKTYVCVICKKTTSGKSLQSKKCCGKEMVLSEKGTWNA